MNSTSLILKRSLNSSSNLIITALLIRNHLNSKLLSQLIKTEKSTIQMLFKQLVCGVLAVSGASAVALKDKGGDLSTAGVEWTLKELNKNVGNLKYTRPHEAEVFDLGPILAEWYDAVG